MIPADKIDVMNAALAEAVASGSITKAQARQFRAEVGIKPSMFTKKTSDALTKKKKRKSSKAARRHNRK